MARKTYTIVMADVQVDLIHKALEYYAMHHGADSGEGYELKWLIAHFDRDGRYGPHEDGVNDFEPIP